MAGPAFRGGVKFVIFYVFGSFLQHAAKIDPIQSALPPVSNPSLEKKERGGAGTGDKGVRKVEVKG